MELITQRFDVFISQNGIIKDNVVNKIFKSKKYIVKNGYKLYFENDILVMVIDEMGYLCKWKGDYTIVIYKYLDKCKSMLYIGKDLVNTINLETDDNNVTYFNILMDYYELVNMLEYNCLYSSKLSPFLSTTTN